MDLLRIFRRSKPLLEVLSEYFTKKGIGLKESTHEKHKFYYKNIELFLASKKKSDIMLHEVKPPLMEELRVWLYETRSSCSKGHASRHIKHCKEAFRHAVKLGYYSHNPIEAVEIENDKTNEPVSLKPQEIYKLLRAEFTNKNFDLVTDLFLFQCFTGLSYIDLWKYEIKKENGIDWITSPEGRGKNGRIYWVEFNDYAADIHEKYGGHFPQITNQSYNRTIKKIALRLGINKELSTHDARKTFATLKYKQGYSIESIADQLGNTPDTTRKHYITKGNDRIKSESRRLIGTSFLNFGT